jgi:hypothetical protein
MRILILNTDYPEFLSWLYAQHPGLENQPYKEQMQVRNESLFGTADFYSSNLHKLGHEAYDIHANNEWMQKAWGREHGIEVNERTPVQQRGHSVLQHVIRLAAGTPLRYLRPMLRPLTHSLSSQPKWFYDILAAQIKHYKPDVLFNQNIGGISTRFLQEIKPRVKLLVGEHGSVLSEKLDLRCYDLITSLLPDSVTEFRQLGVHSELHRLAFEPRILSHLKDQKKTIDISFVGGLYEVHSSRIHFLEVLATRFGQMQIWGPGVTHLSKNSPIRKRYAGQAWGLKMYQVICRSAMTLNTHGDKAAYAGNMRLYEATGVGTLLITDWKENLHEMFEPGKEVVAYRTPDECAELIRYYLEHDEEREAIARAGQERTLREHTYYKRMQELVDILERYLSYPKSAARVISVPGSQR